MTAGVQSVLVCHESSPAGAEFSRSFKPAGSAFHIMGEGAVLAERPLRLLVFPFVQ